MTRNARKWLGVAGAPSHFGLSRPPLVALPFVFQIFGLFLTRRTYASVLLGRPKARSRNAGLLITNAPTTIGQRCTPAYFPMVLLAYNVRGTHEKCEAMAWAGGPSSHFFSWGPPSFKMYASVVCRERHPFPQPCPRNYCHVDLSTVC